MKSRPLIWVAGLALLAAAAAWWLSRRAEAPTAAAVREGPIRIVSLAPAVTETLFAIGAGDRVVGVSDYCNYPESVRSLPRAGTGISPNYEAVTRLSPTVIVSEANQATKHHELEAIAPTKLLPWLALDEVVSSVRTLGDLTARSATANDLADRMDQRLSRTPPADAPDVLLVLAQRIGRLEDVWFVRRNSLHGAVLRAAGGRNAVQKDVHGLPRMSLEEVVRLDPSVIVVLLRPDLPNGDPKPAVQAWKQLETLQAVQNQRIGVIDGARAFANGPRILDLVDLLAQEIRRLAP